MKGQSREGARLRAVAETLMARRERYLDMAYEVHAGAHRISTVTAGSGEQHVICLHGLGGTKSSFFGTVEALSRKHTVHAIDFPGFGNSTKPPGAAYDAEWFAGATRDFMDALGIDRAHLVGNSMGGRVAIEVGLSEPDRVASLSLLAPALAWRKLRQLVPLVRLLRPEIAGIPHPMLSRIVRREAKSLFADHGRMDPEFFDIACTEFCEGYRSAGSRIAFYKAARNIYLDTPFGHEGFYKRLTGLGPPALFIFGDRDRLVPAAFSRHVTAALPQTRCVTLENCGHVPQLERPEQTHRLLRGHIDGAANLGSSLRKWAMRAAS